MPERQPAGRCSKPGFLLLGLHATQGPMANRLGEILKGDGRKGLRLKLRIHSELINANLLVGRIVIPVAPLTFIIII